MAETNDHITLPNGDQIELGTEGIEELFALLFAALPPGGHLMVAYDSAQRAETPRALR